jgi:hypothetical protein
MIEYLHQRSIKPNPNKSILIKFLYDKYYLNKKREYLLSIIDHSNIKLNLEFYNCHEGIFIEELVFKLPLYKINDTFILENIEDNLYDDYHFYYLIIKTYDNRTIFTSEVIRMSKNNFVLYPPMIEYNLINKIKNNVFKWRPTKLQLERIVQINEDIFFGDDFLDEMFLNIVTHFINSFLLYLLITLLFLVFAYILFFY